MSRKLTVVVNPEAGRGRARRLLARTVKELRARDLDPEVLISGRPGETVALAAGATSDLVLAMGGDGTVQEVVNGIQDSGKTLGILPMGSGNDLCKSLRIPTSLSRALDVLEQNKLRQIDLGRVTWSTMKHNAGARFFVNGLGIGFDASVAVRTSSFRFLRGLPMYAAALLATLGRYRSPDFRVSADGRSLSGRRLLIAVGNGHSAGGGFLLTPEARPDDGMLDVCTIGELSAAGILRIVPSVLRGKHTLRDDVVSFRTTALAVESGEGFPVHADGEILGEDLVKVELEVCPGAVGVVVP